MSLFPKMFPLTFDAAVVPRVEGMLQVEGDLHQAVVLPAVEPLLAVVAGVAVAVALGAGLLRGAAVVVAQAGLNQLENAGNMCTRPNYFLPYLTGQAPFDLSPIG